MEKREILNDPQIEKKIINANARKLIKFYKKYDKDPIFSVGEKVRYLLPKTTFRKDWLPSFSSTVHQILSILPTVPPQYVLDGFSNNRRWYEYQLTKADSTIYRLSPKSYDPVTMSFSPYLNRLDREQKETKEQNQRDESVKEVGEEEKEKEAEMREGEKKKTNGDDHINNNGDTLTTKEQRQGIAPNGQRRERREEEEEEEAAKEEEEEEEEEKEEDKPRYKLVRTSLVPSTFTRSGRPRSFDKQFILETNDKKMKRRVVDERTYESLKQNGSIEFDSLP